jgi:type IV pilus assembly protein PilA
MPCYYLLLCDGPKPTTLNSNLQLALLKRKKSKNALEKGFTLVELMIVIVIVGILSAVALPNFLNQTGKAKATEAQTKISAALKSVGAEYHAGTLPASNDVNSTACTQYTPQSDGSTAEDGWLYEVTKCSNTDVTFQGTNSKDFGTDDGIVEGTLNPSTGVISGITFSTS